MSVIKLIKTSLAALTLAVAFAVPNVTLTTEGSVAHASTKSQVQSGVRSVDSGGNSTDVPGFIRNVVNILLFIVGAIAVLMIVIGGLRYVTSAGDSNSVSAAKNTILYAVVGLVVAIMAYAIVNFVVDRIVR